MKLWKIYNWSKAMELVLK